MFKDRKVLLVKRGARALCRTVEPCPAASGRARRRPARRPAASSRRRPASRPMSRASWIWSRSRAMSRIAVTRTYRFTVFYGRPTGGHPQAGRRRRGGRMGAFGRCRGAAHDRGNGRSDLGRGASSAHALTARFQQELALVRVQWDRSNSTCCGSPSARFASPGPAWPLRPSPRPSSSVVQPTEIGARSRGSKPKPPGDDLPPIVPRESSAPPPPDDRPYDNKLMRLAEILGAVHYLRELCGAQEGQIWRDQMKEILRNEGTTAVRRAKLVNASMTAIAATGAPTAPAPSRRRSPPSRFSSEGRHDRRLARARLDLREQRVRRRQARGLAGCQQEAQQRRPGPTRKPPPPKPMPRSLPRSRLARGDRQRVASCAGSSSGDSPKTPAPAEEPPVDY